MAKIKRTREERKQDRSERREGRQLRNELKRLNIVNNKIGDVTVAKEGTRKGQLESKPVLSESQQSDVNRAIEAMKQWYTDAGRYDEGDVLWSKIEGAQNPREVYNLATESFYRDPSDRFEREEFKEYKKDDGLIDFNKEGDYLGSMGRRKGLAPARYMNEAFPEYKPKYKKAREWTGSTGLGSDYYTDDVKEYSKKHGFGTVIKPEFDMTEEVRPEFNKHAGRNPELKPLPVANLEYSFPEETPVSPYNSNQLAELISKDKSRKQERELRREERRSERYNDKRERQGTRLAERLAKSDAELIKNKAGKFMAENPAVGQTLSKIAQGRGFGGYTPPTTTEVDNSTIQTQANSVPTAGMQLASAVANNPDATLTDLNKLPEATKAVNNAQNEQDAAIANQAVATNNVVAEVPKAEVPAVGAEVAANDVANTEQGGIPSMPIRPAQTIDNAGTMPTERISGDGSMINQQIQGGAATFDQGLTKDKVQSEVTKGALQGLSSSPVVAIEKLGIQDYFPNAGESIAAGSYSGKYIGNTTIFAAPGARVPFGLYDARMRALKEAAAEKQKSIDAILTAPQTEAQYQQQFNDSFFGENGVERFIAKHGNNPDAILNDPEFREWMADKQAKARDITQAVSVAKATLDQYNKSDAYIPDAIRDVSMKLLYGQAPDFKEYLEGKGTLSKLVQDNIVYQNVMPQVEELMKQVTAPDRLTERPFNFRTGGKYDDPTFVAERNKFMERVMNGDPSLGADVYASGVIKYFDVEDIDQSIRALVNGQNGSEEQTPQLMLYAAGMIPKESIKFSYETIRTDEVEWARLREAQRQYDTTRQDNSYWGQINAMQTDQVNKGTDKSANQNLKDIQAMGLSGQDLLNAMESHYRTYGAGASMPGTQIKKDKNGTFVTVVPALQQGQLKTVGNTADKKFTVKEYNKSTGKWTEKQMTAQEIGSSDRLLSIEGKGKLDAKDKKEFEAAGGSMWTRVTGYEIKQAFRDKNGEQQYLKADGSNLSEFNSSNEKFNYAIPIEKAFTRRDVWDDKEYKWVTVDTPLPGSTNGYAANINNPADAMFMDVESNIKAGAAANTAGNTSTVTVSSGSSTTTER